MNSARIRATSSPDRIAFTELVRVRTEPGLSQAVAEAARLNRTTAAEWMRRALREKLEADGVSLPPLDGIAMRNAA